MKKFEERVIESRNSIENLIDDLVNETLEIFDTYEEAINTIRQLKFSFTGSVGHLIIEESIERIKKLALKNAAK
ncbi:MULTISPECIES: hypothetical protein [unclassified Enterococcus]|uniref:hypothetical protein n=1 Tax=unclassified Enterococcus TaxID=2608891 RepID=UPI0013ECFC68|nr:MULTISPECIES: hypothetical protein [unclassified Enterococcus]